MLEQIHPSATKAKDDRYYNMESDVRNQATRKNYMNFWEQGMHVKHDTLNQSGKVFLLLISSHFFSKKLLLNESYIMSHTQMPSTV